jgi:hypothetical protein
LVFYKDSLSDEQETELLSLLDSLALENGIHPSSLIKIVFYHAVRPDGKVPDKHVKNVESLKELMSSIGFPPLPQTDLQKKTSKQKPFNQMWRMDLDT